MGGYMKTPEMMEIQAFICFIPEKDTLRYKIY